MRAAARAREPSPELDFTDDLEKRLVAQILLAPDTLTEVSDIIELSDLRDPTAAKIFAAMPRLLAAGRSVTLAAVGDELNRVGDLGSIGGPVALAEVFDLETSAVGVLDAACGVRRRSLESLERALCQQAIDGDRLPEARVALREVQESLAALNEGASKKPRLLSADEFATDVAPEAIILGLLYVASTTLLTGASKTGKTWFALQLALCALAGIEFLGLDTRPAVVLLCSMELSAGMVRTRIEELSRRLDLPAPRVGENFHVVAPTADYVPSLNLSSETGCSDLKSLIEQTGAEVVILDTLYRFLPGCDPSDNGEMGRVFGRLNDLAQGTGAALLIIDHTGKGEQLGPVSHSALGASVKGGAARVVAALKRTSKEDGGRWEVNVESHFGSWDEPLHFERPEIEDGTRGGGCVLCTASQAHGLDESTVRRVFANHGERIDGRPVFASRRKLIAALEAEKLCSGNSQGDSMVRSIIGDYCAPDTAQTWGKDRPIVTSDGPRNATVFTWRMVEPEEPCPA